MPKAILFTTVIAGCGSATLAQEAASLNGWRTIPWGATVEQARAAVPELAPMPVGALSGKVPNPQGPFEPNALWIPVMKIGAIPFRVEATFDRSGGLALVSCVDETEATVANQMEYEILTSQLTAKYGSPTSDTHPKPNTTQLVAWKAIWSLPKTIITLRLTGLASIPPGFQPLPEMKFVGRLPVGYLYLSYQPRGTAFNDKL
jgi:hypothetical protein